MYKDTVHRINKQRDSITFFAEKEGCCKFRLDEIHEMKFPNTLRTMGR